MRDDDDPRQDPSGRGGVGTPAHRLTGLRFEVLRYCIASLCPLPSLSTCLMFSIDINGSEWLGMLPESLFARAAQHRVVRKCIDLNGQWGI
jgi:hypothetical protein